MSDIFGYLGEHWRGELSLFTSFWINTIALSFVVAGFFEVVNSLAMRRHRPGRNGVVTLALVFELIAMVAITVWMCVGLWRSADASSSEWAWWSKAVVWFTAISLPLGLHAIWANYRSYFGDRQAAVAALVARLNGALAEGHFAKALELHTPGSIASAAEALRTYFALTGDISEGDAEAMMGDDLTAIMSLKEPVTFVLTEAEIVGRGAKLTLERQIGCGEDALVDIVETAARQAFGEWAFKGAQHFANPPARFGE